jgi:fermentation-respiration switch protein FrsA (DUF1100 family)
MKRWQKVALRVSGIVLLVLVVGLLAFTRSQAHELVTHPLSEREPIDRTPADFGLEYEDVSVTTSDGLKLVGWYIPSKNGAVIMAQHGYKGDRRGLLEEAQMLERHGYGVLLTSVRGHDLSEGEVLYFGHLEMQDLDAWYQYLLTRPDVDPDRVGILGNSMGGMLVILYAAQNDQIQAVVAHSPPSSFDDTVATTIEYYTGLPPFPFAPLIVFWGEQEIGFDTSVLSPKSEIGGISPRPVFLLHGGQDIVVSQESGQLLSEAAGEPKEYWFEPALGHVEFDTAFPEEYEARVIAFFDQYVLGN